MIDPLQALRDKLESMTLETGLTNQTLTILYCLGKQLDKHFTNAEKGRVRGLVYNSLTELRIEIQPPASAAKREGVEAFYIIALAAFTAGENS